jgi:hypothetical protein
MKLPRERYDCDVFATCTTTNLHSTMSDSEENDVFGVRQHELVPPAPIKATGTSEIDFDGLLLPPLKLHEDLKNGCGGQLWPAGMVLSKYMLRKHASDLPGKTMYAHCLLDED